MSSDLPNKRKNVQGVTGQADANEVLESVEYIEQYIKDKYRYDNVLDFSTASNFAVYGSAQEYYDFAIESIQDNYPYDGSGKEKLEWANTSNPLDLYIFDKEYPRTNGYVIFNVGAVSTAATSGSANNHRRPTKKEYISFTGDTVGNLWNTSSYRGSNLEINGGRGNTVEFWLKKAGFSTSNRREVILDVWSSGSVPTEDHKYGRFTIELDQPNHAANKSPFVITYKSGSAGVHQAQVGAVQLAASASDDSWHHYAFTIQNTGSNLSIKTYVDGKLNHSTLTGSNIGSTHRKLFGVIGALSTAKAGKGQSEDPPYNTPGNSNLGWGKLSGSLDEFRYWKTMRSQRDISTNWFTQVNGGTNTDDANTKLGVYFKFNEGIARTDPIGKIILDYSGRLSNGSFFNYTSSNRRAESAMVLSGKATREFKDPIIQSENLRLINFKTEKKRLGYERDLLNSSALINSIPAWIIEEDEGRGNTKKLLQIIGTYFDVLYAQTTKLAELKHNSYSDFSKEKPFPYMEQVLESFGLKTDSLFLNASLMEVFNNRTEDFEFENKLHDVKNIIYKSLYNSLNYINKSKGTEKAIRNILRTHGIDEELVELKTYSDGQTYEIKPNYRANVHKTQVVDFHREANQRATVFQFSSSFGRMSKSSEFPERGFITGSGQTISTEGLSFTTEAEVYFPALFPVTDHDVHISTPLSSSIFGAHTVPQNPSLSWTAAAKDFANFHVVVAKDFINSKSARFVLKSRTSIIGEQQTKLFRDVYSSKKWNLAFRLKPSGSVFGNALSGSNSSYVAELYGVNVQGGEVADKFLISKTLTQAQGQDFHKFSKRIFAGAERNNTVGGVTMPSDVQISYVRHWGKYLDDSTIVQHAIDSKNAGIKDASKRAFSTHTSISQDILNTDTLALHWDFVTLTGSSAGGNLVVLDASSGSADKVSQFGQMGQILAYHHPGRGFGFPASSTASVRTQYFPTYRETGFENIRSSDLIDISSFDDQTFPKNARPVDYLFTLEKSMYKTISQEMIDMFESVNEYSNLIGDPINRYRPNYKAMEKVRSKFFEDVENVPSFERFMEFYRWIDSSLSTILNQFIPLSAKYSGGIKNIVESHDLERNKYWTKFPTLEKKQVEPSANILGINELLYDWEHGHAPLTTDPRVDQVPGGNDNCLWRKDRAIRTTDAQVFGKRPINEKSIRFASNGDAVSIPDSNAFSIGDGTNDSPFSFSAWVYIGDVTADSGVFTSKRDADAGTAEYFFGHTLGNINIFIYDNNTTNRLKYVSTGKLSSATWHHIAITYDGGATTPKHNGVNVYVDGAVFAGAKTTEGTYVASHNTATEPYIGATKTPTTNTFEDFIADVAYFDKTLTAAEVTEIRNGGKVYDMSRFSAINNIIAWYKMGDDLDATGAGGIKDYINTNHATLIGGAAIVAQSPASDTFRVPLDGLNSNRETIRRVANTDVSGSTYAIRKLTRPYRLDAGFQHVLHGGDNFHLNKKKDFFKATTNPESEDFISVDATKINVDTCPDVHVPRYRLKGGQVFEKKRYGGEANISDTNRDHDINTVLPFSLYTSSVPVPVGYQKFIADEFKKGVDITNLHNDSYGDDREIPVQGPFQEQHIGGHFHRHLETNRGADLDERGDRREAFFISASNGELFVLNPDMEGRLGPKKFNTSFTGSYAGRVNFMREPLAKRPVNIRNIKTTTGSAHLGNYQHVYEAVMGTSTEMSKKHLLENLNTLYNVKIFHSQSSGISGHVMQKVGLDFDYSSSYFYGFKNRVRPGRKTAKHVITSRFSAPGGPETAGDAHGGAHIDVATNQLSVYNNLNYRNLTQRLTLDLFASERQEQYGHRFKSSITASAPTASFHKVNRNHRYIGERNSSIGDPRGGKHDILVRSDNEFVQHHIPQSDLGYSWIRKSAKETTGSFRGHQNRFTHPVGLTNETSSAPIFISASAIGVAQHTNEPDDAGSYLFLPRWLGLVSEKTVEHGTMHGTIESGQVSDTNMRIDYFNMQRVSHVGLNNIIRDNVTAENNTLGFQDDLVLLDKKQTWFNKNKNPFIRNPYWNGSLWEQKDTKIGDGTFNSGIGGYNETDETRTSADGQFNGVLTAHYTGALDTLYAQPGSFSATTSSLDNFIVGTGSHNIQGHAGIHLLLNGLIANRGGSLGYNSWNQLRVGQHKLARKFRKQNVFNFVASKIQLPFGTNEDANPDRFRFRVFTPFVNSEYSWPDNIDFAKAKRARRVDNVLTRFTESAATANSLPIRFQNFYLRNTEGQLTKVDPSREVVKPAAVQTISITYDNAFENFSNEDMKDFLRINDLNPPRYLDNFAGNETIERANAVITGRTIFPREQNLFFNKIRTRENFRNDWAKLERSENLLTSQGNFLTTGSSWGLLSYNNFNSSTPHKLGTDFLGKTKAEGELLSNTGIFRSGPGGRGLTGYPSPAATYARKFAETPQVYKIHIKQNAFTYTALSGAGSSTGSLREASFFIGNPRVENPGKYFITVVPPHHPDTTTRFPDNTIAYIKLSESATTTRAAVDQIVDGLNSYKGRDGFSTSGILFKDVARAKASSDKRTIIIEMFQAYENSILPYDTAFGKQIVGGAAGAGDQQAAPLYSPFLIYSNRFPKAAQFGLLTLESNMPLTADTTKPLEDRGSAAAAFFSASISRNTYLAGAAEYEIGSPWQAANVNDVPGPNGFDYSSYQNWSEQLRKFKDYSVIPEYRISEEMTNYVGVNADDPFFECPQDDFLRLTGSNSSFNDSSKDSFYEVLSHSDFIKNFNTTFDQLKGIDESTRPDEISLTCDAVKKLLPYEGFYPSQRITQLAKLFNDSYGPETIHVGEDYSAVDAIPNFRNALAPFFAPGIAFNSIKSGIAVDYPLVVPKRDRPFAAFTTGFAKNDNNTVVIGNSKDWAHVLTGSATLKRNKKIKLSSEPTDDRSMFYHGNAASGLTGQPNGISVSMWIKPKVSDSVDTDQTGRSTLISFGGSSAATDTPGIQFYLPTQPDTTGSLRLSLSGAIMHASNYGYRDSTEVNSGAEHVYSASIGPLKGNQWNFVGFSLQIAPAAQIRNQTNDLPIIIFRCNEHTVTASLSQIEGSGHGVRLVGNSGSAPHLVPMDTRYLNLKGGHANCMIGNSPNLRGTTNSPAFQGKISEVCIYNSFLESDDYDGLFGGGVKQRGPWRPDMCVKQNKVDSIVGWYRMGNETGIMSLSASLTDDANATNRLKMRNKAWPKYSVKHFKRVKSLKENGSGLLATGTGFQTTGSAFSNEIANSGFPYDQVKEADDNTYSFLGGSQFKAYFPAAFSLTTASFSGFSQGGVVGVIDETELTGAFKYPSYITGSHYNETADGGIPRIGSASWGFVLDGTRTDASQDSRLTSWQTGSDDFGIQRIERLPFEAIVDPRTIRANFLNDTGNGIEERFVVHETEPHPSASLQPASYSKFTTSTQVVATTITIPDDFVSAHTDSGLTGNSAAGNVLVQRFFVHSATKTVIINISTGNVTQFSPVVLIGEGGATTRSTENFIDEILSVIQSTFGDRLRIRRNSENSFTLSDGSEAFVGINKNYSSSGDFTGIISNSLVVTKTPRKEFDDLGNLRAIFGQPVTSSILTSSLNLTSMKAVGDTTYTHAANNFYAETMNFFLQNGQSTVIASADTPQTTVDYGKTYKMKIRMSRVNTGKDFPIYSLPQAFGPALDATFNPNRGNDRGAFSTPILPNTLLSQDVVAHGYSGFTPPHFDRFAEVEYTFTPDENENYEVGNPGAIETIINRITINNKTTPTIRYNRFVKATGSVQKSSRVSVYEDEHLRNGVVVSGFTDAHFNTAGTTAVTSSFNKRSAMQLSASFRGLGLDDSALVSIFRADSEAQDVMRKQLIIQSKWECPNLSFESVTPKQASIAGISVPKGMWHQKGQDKEVTRVEIMPPEDTGVGDLGQLLGMKFRSNGEDLDTRSRTIGLTQDSKVISEAVVAIPFFTRDSGEKEFLHFDDNSVRRIYQEVKLYPGHSNFRKSDRSLGGIEVLRRDAASNTNQVLQPLRTIQQDRFVKNMVANMIQHVLPPKLNFLKYNDSRTDKFVKPYLMYIFPFTHTLNKQDLQDIWQNLPPAIGKETYNRPGDGMEQSITVSHTIAESPLEDVLNQGKMEQLRWMIFKVKRAAEKSYFRKLDLDRLPTAHPERELKERDMFECGFNWPYDYFSLVELIKLKADVVFAKFDRARRVTTGGRSAELEIVEQAQEQSAAARQTSGEIQLL